MSTTATERPASDAPAQEPGCGSGRGDFTIQVAIALGAVAVAVLLSVAIGSSQSVSIPDAFSALLGQNAAASAVVHARLDRTLIALLVGSAVALSGTALQGLTRNPLADPGILGVNAGASLAVVTGLTIGVAGSQLSFIGLALLGGTFAAVAVYAIASAGVGGASPITLALTGAAVTAGCTSLTAAMLMRDQGALDVFRFWQVGSVGGRNLDNLPITLPFLVVGAGIVIASARTLNALALGDDLARSLGQRVLPVRLLIATGAVLLACTATSIAGPIAFVGLIVPHLVRFVVGPDHSKLLPLSALHGATILVLADVIGRVIAPPGEVSAGILTALIGVPALLVLLRRKVVML